MRTRLPVAASHSRATGHREGFRWPSQSPSSRRSAHAHSSRPHSFQTARHRLACRHHRHGRRAGDHPARQGRRLPPEPAVRRREACDQRARRCRRQGCQPPLYRSQQHHADPDQARDPDHRREPHFRSRVRHLHAASGSERAQPAVGRHRQGRRHAGPERRARTPVAGIGHRCVLHRARTHHAVQDAAVDQHGRRPDQSVFRIGSGGAIHRTGLAHCGVRRARRRWHRPEKGHRRHALPGHAGECAGRHARVDQLPRLCQQPRAPVLPDVAAARLQHADRVRAQPERLPQRTCSRGWRPP